MTSFARPRQHHPSAFTLDTHIPSLSPSRDTFIIDLLLTDLTLVSNANWQASRGQSCNSYAPEVPTSLYLPGISTHSFASESLLFSSVSKDDDDTVVPQLV